MKVILQQDVTHLGSTGDVVKVRDGYGRNFLVPRGLAVVADESNTRQLAHLRRQAAAKAAREMKAAKELGERLTSTAITIRRESGDEDKLFGAVTNRDIAMTLEAEGIVVDRRQVELADPIKRLGVFTVPVRLHRDVLSQVKVYVIQA